MDKKYVSLMNNYLEQITPAVSDTWPADELYLKVRGNIKYLFALMDDETKFWIAQEVADTKFTHSARVLFRQGKELMGKKPSLLITDGLPAYRYAYATLSRQSIAVLSLFSSTEGISLIPVTLFEELYSKST